MNLKRHSFMTYIMFALALVLLVAGAVIQNNGAEKKDSDKLLPGTTVMGQAGLVSQAEKFTEEQLPEVLRFHVLANSDDKEDQQLKIEVKDILVNYLKEKLVNVETLAQAKEAIISEMPNLEGLAIDYINSKGFDYQVTGEIGVYSFPTRLYGDTVFAAGEYEAVRIIIGEGKGENWWCVLFPALCFIEGTSIVAEASVEDDYGENIPQSKQENSTKEGKGITIKFKLLELFTTIFNKAS